MTVNPLRSEVVIFSQSDRYLNKEITIDRVLKEIADEAKYLGVLFERKGSWKLQKDAVMTRCLCTLGRCKVICRSLGLTKTETMIQIYNMFTSAIFRYSAGAWWPLAGDLSFIGRIFVNFVKARFTLPRNTSINGILMQFGRRCTSCYAYFLATIQVACGLANLRTVWGQIISSTITDNRILWVRNVTNRIAEMGMTSEILGAPTLFLERRKDYGVQFSQFCHYNHLAIPNGSSAEFFCVDRPFCAFPFLAELPSFRSRFVLLLILSCWRWSNANSANFFEHCPACG
jgi:hypothetical protein